MADRPNTDSREAFDDMEQMAYEEMQSHLAEYPPLDDDYDDEEDWDEYAKWEAGLDDYLVQPYDDDYDGQPDEYTEWQDLHGGDDWDHGQYDEVY